MKMHKRSVCRAYEQIGLFSSRLNFMAGSQAAMIAGLVHYAS
jgi:hypothetical protein